MARPVTITKSGATPVVAGTNVNGLYTITVTNNGGSNINNVIVTDNFPFTITSGTWSAPGGYSGTITGNTLNANIGTINAGQSRTITVNGIIGPTASGVTKHSHCRL